MKLLKLIRARPLAIDWFERMSFLSLTVDGVLGITDLSKDEAELGIFAIARIYAFMILLIATLILLVSRRASRSALVALAGLTVGGLYSFMTEEMAFWPTDYTVGLSGLSLILQLVGLALAVTTPARRWFKPAKAAFND